MKSKEPKGIPAPLARRAQIEAVRPAVDGGRWPVKRIAGDELVVAADVFVDGHDVLRASLLHRFLGESEWTEAPMQPRGNDTWEARFRVERLGRYEYAVRAWIDRFASWRADLSKKFDAGQEVASELLEGAAFLRQAAARATAPERTWLETQAATLESPSQAADSRVRLALGEPVGAAVERWSERSGEVVSAPVLQVLVERERARYGAWYEMFPRSAGGDPKRGATLREAEARLPQIAAMGFDVVYVPPVHPIGKTHRKGPNNTLQAGPDDPGSPWAIGAAAGGHKAIEPALGTLADFDHFVAAAHERGLEIAMDLAFQCSPDHPYAREHPEWFRHRPDGTIKYAENPPKKYQDIYPFDFECEAWESLWEELRDVVRFWIGHGVRIFRVDNPHTKTLGFWGWLIDSVRSEHPDVIFLAEAFTRPKVMQHLAKRGFSQSYSYFTWRNTKKELTDYFTELTQTAVRETMRPNLFANTPDILHEYLQFGGRPAFQVRLVLAATLGATYGIYGPPFELCVGEARPGTEEYQDAEKYQIRVWDWNRPGNIKDFIARVNRIRRETAALHSDWNLRFHPVDNDQLLFYSKTTPDLSNIVLVVVNLDPHHTQSGWVRVPLAEFGLDERSGFQMHDLLGEARYLWHGPANYVSLDPRSCPAHVFRLRRKVKTEQDFDYYM